MGLGRLISDAVTHCDALSYRAPMRAHTHIRTDIPFYRKVRHSASLRHYMMTEFTDALTHTDALSYRAPMRARTHIRTDKPFYREVRQSVSVRQKAAQ